MCNRRRWFFVKDFLGKVYRFSFLGRVFFLFRSRGIHLHMGYIKISSMHMGREKSRELEGKKKYRVFVWRSFFLCFCVFCS